jgi:hypothetical protein
VNSRHAPPARRLLLDGDMDLAIEQLALVTGGQTIDIARSEARAKCREVGRMMAGYGQTASPKFMAACGEFFPEFPALSAGKRMPRALAEEE